MVQYKETNPIYSTLLYHTGWDFLQATLGGVSITELLLDENPHEHLEEIHNYLQEYNEEIIPLLSHLYSADDLQEFTEFINNYDSHIFATTIYDKHQIHLFDRFVDVYYGDTFDRFVDVDGNTGLLVTKNLNYIKLLSKYGIEFIPLQLGYHILDTTKTIVLGLGYNGISFLSNNNDSVVKVTLSDNEYNQATYLMKLNPITEEEQIFKQHFVDIYHTEEIDILTFLIEREFVDGDFVSNEDDELFETEEYKMFEDILENSEVAYWDSQATNSSYKSNYWDIHTGNLITNPNNKDVSFIYFDF